jgi:hypothetical protein
MRRGQRGTGNSGVGRFSGDIIEPSPTPTFCLGGPKAAIDDVLASPVLEAFPCQLTDRFDGIDDPINGPPGER